MTKNAFPHCPLPGSPNHFGANHSPSGPRVMLATSFGPGREWCMPIWEHVLRTVAGISEVLVVWDGTEMRSLAPPPCRLPPAPTPLPPASGGSRKRGGQKAGGPETGRVLPIRHAVLAAWTGGEDPYRFGRLARMRETSRKLFLASDCDYLYWHDSDMIPPASIIGDLLAHEAPVATGCYPMRGLEHAMQPILHCRPADVTAAIQRCSGYGMGCMLVRRDALERTAFRHWRAWEGVKDLGEDWQWGLDSGLPTLVDTRIGCWHCCGPDGKTGEASLEGWASRIVFGGIIFACVWMGGGMLETEFGPWKHGVVRADLTHEQAATLPHGFAVGEAQEMGLEWEDWPGLIGEGGWTIPGML
jgi:hypothetical protein